MLDSYESDYFDNATLIFDTLSNAYNQTLTEPIRFEQGSHGSIYYALRIRTNIGNAVSEWSDIHFFSFQPLSSLDAKSLELMVNFKLAAQKNSDDFCVIDQIEITNFINIDSTLNANGYDISNLIFVKPESGYVEDKTGLGNQIENFVFGYHEPTRDTYPFEVLGDLWILRDNWPVRFYPNGGYYRDIYAELTNERLKMQILGNKHDVDVYFSFNCYFKK